MSLLSVFKGWLGEAQGAVAHTLFLDDTVYHSINNVTMKLPLEMGVLSFVQNVDKELRNGGKASTCGIHAGI